MPTTHATKRCGASVIIVNAAGNVLLVLRDDKPSIPFPNQWDLLGGAVEPGETPNECIVREIKEEIGYSLDDPRLFQVTDFDDRVEYTYFQPTELDVEHTQLNEGQRLRWFSREEIERLKPGQIAFGFQPVLLSFFQFLSRGAT